MLSSRLDGGPVGEGRRTWYFVRRVLHTPVRSIIPTRNGTAALFAMVMNWRLVVVGPLGVM